jgi:tRNA-splicing ligase RtcB
MHGVAFDRRHAGRLVDEAPSAYRDIRTVMRAQRDLTMIHRELRPLVSHKATG